MTTRVSTVSINAGRIEHVINQEIARIEDTCDGAVVAVDTHPVLWPDEVFAVITWMIRDDDLQETIIPESFSLDEAIELIWNESGLIEAAR